MAFKKDLALERLGGGIDVICDVHQLAREVICPQSNNLRCDCKLSELNS
jgi:hypothetical protein